MNLKKIARKGLVILAVVVALCMFFARTILTLTTPKVSITQPQNGRLDQRVSLEAKVYFQDAEPVIYKQAADYPLTVNRVYIRAGYQVKAGDLLFTMEMYDYETKYAELLESYDKEVIALGDKDIEKRRARGHENEFNYRYEAMLRLQREAADARTQARALAIVAGIELSENVDEWLSAAGDNEALKQAVSKAVTKQRASDSAENSFFDAFSDSKVRVSDELFKYIKDREKILKGMEVIEAKMTALTAAREMFKEVRAERDGYIVEIGEGLGEGKVYDGKTMAFSMNNPEKPPVLRADVSSITRVIEKGSKATIKSDRYQEWETTVVSTGIGLDGKRYVDMELNDDGMDYYGGLYAMVMQSASSSFTATVTYRSSSTNTLIPAAALHEDDGTYIYTLDRNNWSGGFMSSGMKARKMEVTVIEKSDKLIAIAEELYGTEIIYRESSAIKDGDSVMEYIN